GVNIADCKFYAFEDELKQCPCERGFCRTVFRKGIKYWCCCVRVGGACGMDVMIKSTRQAWRERFGLGFSDPTTCQPEPDLNCPP
nr:hypothetical protein [Tanacetum cinerariifolium]